MREIMPEVTGEKRDVIARFSWPFFFFSALVWLFLLWVSVLCWRELFLDPHLGTRLHLKAWFGLVLLFPFLAWSAIAGAMPFFFSVVNKGDALWLEAGRLVYADRKKLDVQIGDITAAQLFYNSGHAIFRKLNPELWFRLRDGSTATVRVNPLAGSKDDIIAALEAKLALTVKVMP